MSTRTVFIIGPPRSGTTLLGFLLAGAPGVMSLSEPHLARAILPAWRFQHFLRRYRRAAGLKQVRVPIRCDDATLSQCLESLAEINGFRALVVKETFRVGVSRPAWNNVELLDRLVHNAASATAGRIPTVLIVRHPYDLAASTVKLCRWATGWRGRLFRLRWPDVPWFADATDVVRWAAPNWAAFAAWSQRVALPRVCYEDLVTDTELTLRNVCDSLRLAFDPSMLDYRHKRAAFGGIGDFGVLHRAPRPVDRSAIGRGNALTPEQREIVRSACAAGAAAFGYELK